VRISFDDGHDTGLYSWDLLYDLGREKDETLRLRALRDLTRVTSLVVLHRNTAFRGRKANDQVLQPDRSRRGVHALRVRDRQPSRANRRLIIRASHLPRLLAQTQSSAQQASADRPRRRRRIS
jgi:hypothetical protein